MTHLPDDESFTTPNSPELAAYVASRPILPHMTVKKFASVRLAGKEYDLSQAIDKFDKYLSSLGWIYKSFGVEAARVIEVNGEDCLQGIIWVEPADPRVIR